MKLHLPAIVFVLAFMSFSQPVNAAVSASQPATSHYFHIEGMGPLSTEAFLNLTPRDVKAKTGQRMKFKDRIQLRAAQWQLKRTLKAKGEEVNPGKSQIVALLCVLFFGLLGIHRFYLGYFAIGLIQLFTLGGFGIWATVDFFRILFRDLYPADGLPYDQTF